MKKFLEKETIERQRTELYKQLGVIRKLYDDHAIDKDVYDIQYKTIIDKLKTCDV